MSFVAASLQPKSSGREELCGHQAPDPKRRAGFGVAKRPGGWRNGWEVDGVVVLALPEPVRLSLVMLAASRAECALDQVGCMFPYANPVPARNRIEQHACGLGVGFVSFH